MTDRPLKVDDFDFDLPQELIAQVPLPQRSASRLLRVDGADLADHGFDDLPRLLSEGDLMIFNDVKVIKARFLGYKKSGGRIEVLLERVLDQRTALAQIRASKAPKLGSCLELASAFYVAVDSREGAFFVLRCRDETDDWWRLAERYGRLPLPPYIHREAVQSDEQRYQTVFARIPGAIAAPTAGLHFDEPLLRRLAEMGVETARLTLFVGAGTFQPVRVAKLADHMMHCERYEIPEETVAAIAAARGRQRRVIAVGTTVLRALEAATLKANGNLPRSGPGETDIFITPGFSFRVVDRLVTNFHLPRSTLLMLVAAFAGMDVIKRAYAHAIARRYRFFSYGDAMLLDAARHPLLRKEAHGI